MAETNGNESPERPTRTVTEFPETIGKVIQSIQVYVTADHYSADINFTDNTALILSMEASINLRPYIGDWKTGDCEVLKEWPEIKSISLRA